MKIALIVPGGVDRSGEYRVIPAVLALIARLARRHEVHVFALAQEPLPATWQLAGATIHNIGQPNTLWRGIGAIRREHARAPFDLLQALWSGDSGLLCTLAAAWLRRPALVHLTGGELFAFPEIDYGGQLRWPRRMLEKFVLARAAGISATSAPIVAAVQRHGRSARRIPFGVDLASWPIREPQRRTPGTPARLIHVASLNRVKSQPVLLQALAALAASGHDFTLDVIGDDTLGGEIQALAQRLDLDSRVRFLGFKTQRELRPLMEAAHVHVLSSHHEAGPYVLLEAAIAGVPTAGTAVGHLSEWPAEATSAVPVGDAAALAGAIGRLLLDETLRLSLARAAQLRAIAEDADFTAQAFEHFHAQLAG